MKLLFKLLHTMDIFYLLQFNKKLFTQMFSAFLQDIKYL